MIRAMPILMSRLRGLKTPKVNFYGKKFRFGLLAGIGLACIMRYGSVQMSIEDNEIKKAKSEMHETVNKLRRQFGQMTVYPEIKFDLRGNKYTVEFQIDQRKCNIFNLITQFFNQYNAAPNSTFRVLDFKTFSANEIVTLYIDFQEQDPKWKTPQKGRVTITGVRTSERPNFRLIFQKDDCITPKNIKALSESYREAIKPKEAQENLNNPQGKAVGRSHSQQSKKKPENELYKKLEQYGVTIFDPRDKSVELDWDYLAGYETQKRSIEETILLALTYPEIYDEITQHTRVKNQPNRPKAILFEGPPGTGKTTSAKIIAQQVNIPLIYLPIESIMSELYGKSEQKLSEMWETCKKIGKVIIFIDEIDALAGNRSSDMHEASRRILSTLLRKIDSFQSTTDVMLICATNRKQDLDPAMLSRIDLSIKFSLPDCQSRTAIFQRYAKHLSENERKKLAEKTEGFSGRNISDICKHAERRWASKLIRKEVEEKLPDFNEYLKALNDRRVTEEL